MIGSRRRWPTAAIGWLLLASCGGTIPGQETLVERVKVSEPFAVGGPEDGFARVSRLVAEIDRRELMYSPRPEDLRDCSGIFHRLLADLRRECPEFAAPPVSSHRSSRAIAAWYSDADRLILVTDPVAQDRLIRPGAVLFYGRRGSSYPNVDLEAVTTETEHVGVVIAVSRDSEGRVSAYQLFHGRSAGKPATITDYHRRQPTRGEYPPLGNGRQPLIAATSLCADDCCAD